MKYTCASCGKSVDEATVLKTGGGIIWNYYCNDKCKDELAKKNNDAWWWVMAIIIGIPLVIFLIAIS